MTSSNQIQDLNDMANILRVHAIKMTDASKSGHPTSCASIAEILSVLFFHENGMHFDPKNPKEPANDRLVLSKGHAAPIYYAAWAEAGNFPKEELLNLRKITSDLEGHPTPRLSFVDFATGSLGQGLANAAGLAYSSKYFDKNTNKFFCIVGDGEFNEGSVLEAVNFSTYYKLDNLIMILDVNRYGQSDLTAFESNLEVYSNRLRAFGANVIEVDGHSVTELIDAYGKARNSNAFTAIVCKTLKGKGFTDVIEDKLNWHGKAICNQKVIESVESKIVNKNVSLSVTFPKHKFEYKVNVNDVKYTLPDLDYKPKDVLSTREAFGRALKKLGDIDGNDRSIIIGLDGDVKNSTFSDMLYKSHKDKFINCFIAEQLMVGVAQGLSKSNKIPFTATFATFYSRAFDQIRVGAISQDNVKYVGTHTGCHIGEDGPSQMGLEDLSYFRAVPEMVIFTPSCPVAAERAVELAANHTGSVYIRTERNPHALIYSNTEKFNIGEIKVLRKSDNDLVTIVSSGATLHEALAAYELLKKEGINVRVIDVFTIKPIDKNGLIENISLTNNQVIVIEDHYYEGGLGEAVLSALATSGIKVYHKAVSSVPRSGKPDELFKFYGLDADSIVIDVKSLIELI